MKIRKADEKEIQKPKTRKVNIKKNQNQEKQK
jgi:hypothetical protein